mgnify:CR=1 FL=1|tara:strand:- start:8308 stop:9003 length:696 start_codon:yes stop_codon:yes gene_type:complete
MDTQVLVALDVPTADDARRIVEDLHAAGLSFGVKIGMELATATGHSLVQEIAKEGIYVFDDQKRVDIPNTLKKAAKVQAGFGANMMNCMCAAGPKGISAFADACKKDDVTSIGVTVLTTKTDEECQAEFGRTALGQVNFYARWAQEHGLNGVVCSPLEIETVKNNYDLLTVTPGIRPSWSVPNDQKRVTTPAEAVRRGADWLVIGRPITSHEYGPPADNLKSVLDEIASVG